MAVPGAHQSGVNAVSAACLGDGGLLLLSGGDDQAIRLTELRVMEDAGRLTAGIAASWVFPNAHSSAVKVSQCLGAPIGLSAVWGTQCQSMLVVGNCV